MNKLFKTLIFLACLTQAPVQAHAGEFLSSTKGYMLMAIVSRNLANRIAPLKPNKEAIFKHMALNTLTTLALQFIPYWLVAYQMGPTIEDYKKKIPAADSKQLERLAEYEKIAKMLSQKTGLKINSFHVLSSPKINAAASGSRNNAHVTITSAWLTTPMKDLSEFNELLTAVLAHELGHVSMSHTTKTIFAFSVLLTLTDFIKYKLLCSWSDAYQKIQPHLATTISEIPPGKKYDFARPKRHPHFQTLAPQNCDVRTKNFLEQNLIPKNTTEAKAMQQFNIDKEKTIAQEKRASTVPFSLVLLNRFVLIQALSRFFEYQADAYAAQHGYSKGIQTFFRKYSPTKQEAKNSLLSFVIRLIGPHPSADKRVARLAQPDVATKSVWTDPDCWKFW